MTIQVALHHKTSYTFDRPVALSPHEVRLRPAAHCRTPILSYSLRVTPAKHFVNWQQDGYGNWMARYVFPEPARELIVEVDLVAEMTVINPFDFFVEQAVEQYPFAYADELKRQLAPFLEAEPAGPLLSDWIERAKQALLSGGPMNTRGSAGRAECTSAARYSVHRAHGARRFQTRKKRCRCERGSCRDSGWLLVQILRHLGFAARFVSGYLIQLMPTSSRSTARPARRRISPTCTRGPRRSFPAPAGSVWTPTSGLLAGEGHIPLAAPRCPPAPRRCSASPMSRKCNSASR